MKKRFSLKRDSVLPENKRSSGWRDKIASEEIYADLQMENSRILKASKISLIIVIGRFIWAIALEIIISQFCDHALDLRYACTNIIISVRIRESQRINPFLDKHFFVSGLAILRYLKKREISRT